MKKSKEFLLLFVPLIVLTVLPVILLVVDKTNDFVGFSNSLTLLLADGIFWTALFNIYFKALAFAILAVVCIALLCHFIKRIKSRKIFYPVSVALASVVSFTSICVNKVVAFGAPMGSYDPSTLLSSAQPTFSVSVYEILLALQIGFLTTLLFWLAERIFVSVKNK